MTHHLNKDLHSEKSDQAPLIHNDYNACTDLQFMFCCNLCSGSPSLEVKSMSIQQSIDVPMTVNDTLTFSGHLATQNGNGTGNFTASCRRILSHQAWGEVSWGRSR